MPSADEQQTHLRHYVYTLAYPDGRVFYVGKGVWDRLKVHEREARAGVQSAKCDAIRSIWASGGTVLKRKIAYFRSDEEAGRYERYVIETTPNLTNVKQGGDIFEEAQLPPEDAAFFGASIRHVRPDGQEYWSAREVVDYLGYRDWRPIQRIIHKIERIFTRLGVLGSGDICHMLVSVELGKGAVRQIEDIEMSGTAFLLLVQNADPKKARVALGKNYIARTALRYEATSEGDERLRNVPRLGSPVAHVKTRSSQVLKRAGQRLEAR